MKHSVWSAIEKTVILSDERLLQRTISRKRHLPDADFTGFFRFGA
jgi:hypothetical protein